MRPLRVAAFAALVVTLVSGSAIAAETPWTTDPTFADAAQNHPGALSLTRGVALRPYFWGPRGGTEPSPLFVVSPGVAATFVWDADTTGTGTVTLTIQKASGTGSGTDEWEERDVIQAATACTPPATTCSQKIISDPGVYRFVPSAQAANGRLRVDPY